jgi:PAS domain S-box-containing protein
MACRAREVELLSSGSLEDFFPGQSEMARRMREYDWSTTALGDPCDWPEALKIPLRMLLTSRFEMWLGWGDDLLFFYNDAYIPTLGIKHPDMLAKPFREVWAEVYDDVADQVEKVRTGEATWNSALLLLLERSGHPEETYHSFSYSPLYGVGGNVEGLLCIVSEETERVIGERRLETLRRLGANLVGAMDDAEVRAAVCDAFASNRHDFPFVLFAFDEAQGTRYVACTPDAAGIAGHDWDDGISAPSGQPRRVALPGDVPWPVGAWEIAPREALVVPIPGPGDQPAFGSLVLALNPYRRDEEGLADFARLIAGQVSGALANIAALDAERRRADRIWLHSRDLVVVVDADGVFRAVSPSWTRIFGFHAQDVVGKPFADFIVADDLAPSNEALATALSEGDLVGFENRFRTVDGGSRWVSWHTAMEDGLVYAYGRDVTEQKFADEALAAAEDALRQAQKMEAVGQLTGGIAHDFNNLLQGINGSLEIMQKRLEQGHTRDVLRWLEGAKSSADRAAALTHRLLAFSRRQPLDPRPVSVNPLIGSMEDLLGRTLGEDIAVAIDFESDLWRTRCDPNQLESAILNLVINARDAMPDGGRLTIETRNCRFDKAEAAGRGELAPGDYVCINVEDTGVGMDKATIERAFEPFYTTKPLGEGTGLGLSMIYGFARQSEGRVEIVSELGRGSRISIYLPRCMNEDPAQPVVAAQEPNAAVASGEVVLVVEDEPVVRGLIKEVLGDLGYRALEATDGPEGLRILQSAERVDLLVTDIGLPGLNGRQIADAARVDRPDLKILFMTGYAENAALPTGFLERGMAMLTKPFTMDKFARQVQSMIESDGNSCG